MERRCNEIEAVRVQLREIRDIDVHRRGASYGTPAGFELATSGLLPINCQGVSFAHRSRRHALPRESEWGIGEVRSRIGFYREREVWR